MTPVGYCSPERLLIPGLQGKSKIKNGYSSDTRSLEKPVALALSLPVFVGKEVILALTYGVVIFSIIIQGLTLEGLVRRVVPTPSASG